MLSPHPTLSYLLSLSGAAEWRLQSVYNALTLLRCYALVWSAMVAWGSVPGEGVCDWQPQQGYLRQCCHQRFVLNYSMNFTTDAGKTIG